MTREQQKKIVREFKKKGGGRIFHFAQNILRILKFPII